MERNQIEITIEVTVRREHDWSGPRGNGKVVFTLPENGTAMPDTRNAVHDTVTTCVEDYLSQRTDYETDQESES